MPLPSAVFQWPHVCPVTLSLSPSDFMLVFLSVMHDLTTVSIWLHTRLSVTSCMSCTTLPLSSSDFHARLSVTSCLSCTTVPLSPSDFMHVFLRPHVCHARPYYSLPLNSCTSFCDLMSFSKWHKLHLVLSLCPSPAASCLFDRELNICLTLTLYLFERDLNISFWPWPLLSVWLRPHVHVFCFMVIFRNGLCAGFLACYCSVQFGAVDDGIYALGKVHTRSTPSLRSFSDVAFAIAMVGLYSSKLVTMNY